ncbi:MAG: hypothetical protein K9I94_14830 [Bacteroidales bacterium]|nr:hypothetical protein [Bacteroidales bacterium]
MNKQELIASASEINQPSAGVVKEFHDKKEEILGRINQKMLARKDLTKLVGEENLQMMKDNHQNHLRFMESIFTKYNPTVLVETVLWVFHTYRSHGFNLTYWPAFLNTVINVMKEELSEKAFNEIYPIYNWILINQPAFIELTKPQ